MAKKNNSSEKSDPTPKFHEANLDDPQSSYELNPKDPKNLKKNTRKVKKDPPNPFAGTSFMAKPNENVNETALAQTINKITNTPDQECDSNIPDETKTKPAKQTIVTSEKTEAPKVEEIKENDPKKYIGEKNNNEDGMSFDNFFKKQFEFSHSSNVTISGNNLARLKIITGIEDIPTSHTLDTIVSWWFKHFADDIKKNGYDKIIKKKLKVN